MWRAFLLIFILLSASISGMLFWQWEAFSEQKDPDGSESSNIRQEISVHTRANELTIHQKVSGLDEDVTYEVMVPEQLYDYTCINSDGDPCTAEGEQPFAYTSENGELSFSYIIPIEERENSLLLDEWTVTLTGKTVLETKIEVTESALREGAWMSGLPLQGHKNKEYIDYYMFEGTGGAAPLYWQRAPLAYYEVNSAVAYYAEKSVFDPASFQHMGELNDFQSVSVVLTEQYKEYENGSFMIVNKDTTAEQLELKLINNYYHQKFASIQLKEDWLTDIFIAYSIGIDAKTQRGKAVYKELQENLSESELELFYSSVHNEPQEWTADKLDAALTKIAGFRTSFYSLNSESDQFIPLFYYDDRKLIIRGEEKENKIVYEDARILFPLKETMEAFGYHVQYLPEQETVLIQNQENSYRFYLNKNIFILNEDNYGLLQNPLTVLYGDIYMERQWLKSIFNIEIEENAEEVIINAIEQ